MANIKRVGKRIFNYSNILRSSFDLMSRIVRSFGVEAMGAQLVELMGLLKEAYKHHVSHHEITTAVTLLEQFHKTHSQVFVDFLLYVCVNTDSKVFADVNSYPQIITALFEYASRSLIFVNPRWSRTSLLSIRYFKKRLYVLTKAKRKIPPVSTVIPVSYSS